MDYTWPSCMGKGAKKATYAEPPAQANHVAVDPRGKQLRRMQRELDEQRRLLVAMRQQKPVGAQTTPKVPPKPTTYRPMLFVQHDRKDTTLVVAPDTFPLTAGSWIPCQVEPTLNSEIEGLFTVKTPGNVFDSVTGHHLLIPQGRSVVAKDESASLLLGPMNASRPLRSPETARWLLTRSRTSPGDGSGGGQWLDGERG